MRHLFVLVFFLMQMVTPVNADITIANTRFQLEYRSGNNTFALKDLDSKGTAIFDNKFYVQYSGTPPTCIRNKDSVNILEKTDFWVASWKNSTNSSYIYNLFNATPGIEVSAVSATQEGNKINFTYSINSYFSLLATISLEDSNPLPLLTWELKSKQSDNWKFSTSFYGAPEYEASQILELWQPMIWLEKRFPKASFLTPSCFCPLPISAVTNLDSITLGQITDPSFFPFDSLPTFDRSAFGVALRNKNGMAKPMVFYPIMGTPFSKPGALGKQKFGVRLFAFKQNMHYVQEYLANELYGFKSYNRTNVVGSLNDTFDRMLDYIFDPFSGFISEQKAYNYENDTPGSVKNTSPLYALGLAFVTDNDSLYKSRALPMIEYALSRQNPMFRYNLITSQTDTTEYSLGLDANSSAGNVADFAGIYNASGNKSQVFIELAKSKKQISSNKAFARLWRDRINLYEATNDPTFLAEAKTGADLYLNHRVQNLSNSMFLDNESAGFWLYLAPKFVDLMEMYEATKDKKYLDAARYTARTFLRNIWYAPKIPGGSMTVNIGNKAPVYKNKGGSPMYAPEETVESWRLSEIGLNCEMTSTSPTHRAIFNAMFAPFLLRIAAYTNDDFLRKSAKSAIIGRYRNFPGYHMNTDRTTVYEQVDFPLRPFDNITSTSMHFSHVLPFISMVFDYLVSDVFDKSQTKISFPYEFVQGFAQLQGHIYMQKKGTFYGDSAILYMPKNLLNVENKQLNYIVARGNEKLYIAFSNQSTENITSQININTNSLPSLKGTHRAKVWINNVEQPSIVNVNDGVLSVPVAPEGITAIAIEDVNIKTKLQQEFIGNVSNQTWKNDYAKMSDKAASIAHLLNISANLSEVYVYSSAPKGKLTSFSINYSINGGQNFTLTDTTYPFELSIPLAAKDSLFKFFIVSKLSDNTTNTSLEQIFQKNVSPPIPGLQISISKKNYNGNDVSSPTAKDGVITVNATGGVKPYIYTLNNGQSNSTGLFEGLSVGNYYATVKDAVDSIISSSVTIRSYLSSYLDTKAINMLAFYPNPVDRELHIIGDFNKDEVVILSVMGKRMFSENNLGKDACIDCSQLPKGMYVLKFYDENKKVYINKFIKK